MLARLSYKVSPSIDLEVRSGDILRVCVQLDANVGMSQDFLITIGSPSRAV